MVDTDSLLAHNFFILCSFWEKFDQRVVYLREILDLPLISNRNRCFPDTSLRPIYTKRQHQCCSDACDTVLIDHNGVAPKWVTTPFWSDSIFSIHFNESCNTSVLAALTLRFADAWCKQNLIIFYSFREESSEEEDEDEEEQKKKTKKETKRIKKAGKKIADRKKKDGSEEFNDVIDADFDDVSDMDVTGKSKARKKKDKKELTGAAMSGSSVSEILTGAGFSSDTSSAVTMTTQLTGNEALNENSDESPMRHQTRRKGYSDMSPETLLTGQWI